MPSWVIIGASRGLGYEWLRQLSQNLENQVIGVARTPGPVNEKLVADGITNVHVVQGDMADNASLLAAATATSKITGGVVDHLIVNGAYQDAPLRSLSPTDYSGKENTLRNDMIASLEVNVLGVIYSINAFLPLLRKGDTKKITAISTGLADLDFTLLSGNSTQLTYSTMKAALNMVVAKYSQELKAEGFTVLALSPGLVNTRETPPTPEELEKVKEMIKTFQAYAPSFQGALNPEESVKAQYAVIVRDAPDQNGAFLSHWGNKMWL
ncbi:NAD(P)-binding domain protein [Lipomyces doorenjongii]